MGTIGSLKEWVGGGFGPSLLSHNKTLYTQPPLISSLVKTYSGQRHTLKPKALLLEADLHYPHRVRAHLIIVDRFRQPQFVNVETPLACLASHRALPAPLPRHHQEATRT